VHVRRARADEVAALVRLHLDTVLVAYRPWFPPESVPPSAAALEALWSNDLRDAHAVLVVEDDGRLIGSVVARANGDLARLHVLPDRWGEGIGGALHDAAVDVLREHGHARAELWVIAENERARSLYERRGWALDPDRSIKELDVTEVRYWRSLQV
jgi:GNAT superfamily N-acetyltransferase